MRRRQETQKSPRRRPRLFRALGRNEPPAEIEVDGLTYRHSRTYKHDSWAATAFYVGDNGSVVCKFNRTEPILLIPAGWLGRFLARRESKMYEALADLPTIPSGTGRVYAAGRILSHAVAHEYVDGHPLRWHDRVDDHFFGRLRETLLEIHRRSIAYVDMNKRENIIVDRQGQPHLIDFQISVRLPRVWPLGPVLRMLQQSDLYHLEKHAVRSRPDLVGYEQAAAFERSRPWWIKLHRSVAQPFRSLRRRLLVLVGARRGRGQAQSEAFVEEGLRLDPTADSPLSPLLAAITADEYFAVYGGTIASYSEGLFEELFQRAPTSAADRRLVQFLRRRTRVEIASNLLRSTEIHRLSCGWSPAWIEDRLASVADKLASHASSRAA